MNTMHLWIGIIFNFLVLTIDGLEVSDQNGNWSDTEAQGSNMEANSYCVSQFDLGQNKKDSNSVQDHLKVINRLVEKNCHMENRLDQLESELLWLKDHLEKKTSDSAFSSLHRAVYEQNEEEVKVLVQNGTNVNGRDENWETPLILAADGFDKNISVLIIKFLIEHGADVFAKDKEDQTFLHRLVSHWSTVTPHQFDDIATYLVSQNLSSLFNTPGGDHMATSLMWAVKFLEVENSTLTLLHEQGASFTVLEKDGDSIFKYAVEGRRSKQFLGQLADLGADWKIVNQYKFTLLHFAAYFYHVEGIKYFVEKGLDLNAVDAYGTTPLHMVCHHGDEHVLDTVKFMIEKGANAKITNSYGKTPLDDAKLNQRINATEKALLVQYIIESTTK